MQLIISKQGFLGTLIVINLPYRFILYYIYIYIIDIIRIYMYTVCVSCIRIILISFRKMIMVTGNHLQAEEEGNSVG